MRKRNQPVYIRFADDEYKQLMKKVKSSGQTIQSYIINTALNGKVSSTEEIIEIKTKNKLLADIDRQLRGIGTNINQIAKAANTQGFIPAVKELSNIYSEISAMKNEVNKQWQSTRQLISQQKVMEQ